MAQGLDSYKFGIKNNWRRRVWNQAVTRLKSFDKKISDCIVVYLPGPDNIDGEIAISKGFKPWNLYAIEICKERTKLLRSKKINVINDDLNKIIAAWNLKEKIDFLFADFCGGITRNSNGLIFNLIFKDCFSEKMVVAVNLLRGRDPVYIKAYNKFLSDIKKHRGLYFYRLLIMYYLTISVRYRNFNENETRCLIEMFNYMTEFGTNPDKFEYKSKCGKATLVMDSVIFNWGSIFNAANTEKKYFKTEMAKIGSNVPGLGLEFDYNYNFLPHRRKIGAAKAIHTMRKKGVL